MITTTSMTAVSGPDRMPAARSGVDVCWSGNRRYRHVSMMNRRRFCSALAASAVGVVVAAVSGCSNEGRGAASSMDTEPGSTVLEGLAVQVRRDPG